jgi:hypothetical protein
MVKIPTRESTGQLSTRPASQQISDIGTFTQTAVALQRAGQAVTAMSEEFKRLQTLREVSRATIETNRLLTELEQEHLDNPNLSQVSAGEYQAQANKIVQDQLSTIGDEETRLRSSLQSNGTALSTSLNVKRQGRQADVDNAVVETATIIDQSLNDSFQAGPAERLILRKNLERHLENNIAAKLLTNEASAVLLADFDEKLRKGRADFMFNAQTAPGEGKTRKMRVLGAQMFIEQVQQGEYAELTTQEEQTLINDANKFIKRQEEIDRIETEQKQRTNEKNDAGKILDEEITLETVSRETIENGTYSEAFLASVKRHFNDFKSPVAEGETDIQTYVDLIKKGAGMDGFRKEDGTAFTEQEYIQQVIDNTNGKLSLSDAKTLVNKGFDRLAKREANAYTAELENLEARMKIQLFGLVEEGEEIFAANFIQAKVDTFLYRFDKRIGAIEDPSAEQIKEIADEVYREWRFAPQAEGGLGEAGDQSSPTQATLEAGGALRRYTGVDDSDVEVEVNLNFKKKK